MHCMLLTLKFYVSWHCNQNFFFTGANQPTNVIIIKSLQWFCLRYCHGLSCVAGKCLLSSGINQEGRLQSFSLPKVGEQRPLSVSNHRARICTTLADLPKESVQQSTSEYWLPLSTPAHSFIHSFTFCCLELGRRGAEASPSWPHRCLIFNESSITSPHPTTMEQSQEWKSLDVYGSVVTRGRQRVWESMAWTHIYT